MYETFVLLFIWYAEISFFISLTFGATWFYISAGSGDCGSRASVFPRLA